MVLLGALVKIDGFPISLEQLIKIHPQIVPSKAIEANLKAIEMGFNAIKI